MRIPADRLEPWVEAAPPGRTRAFADMVSSVDPFAGINGSFFDAYRPEGRRSPNMMLIHEGQVIFRSNTGTVVGFAPKGILMEHVQVALRGKVGSEAWYAEWVNHVHAGPNSIVIYTRDFGKSAGAQNATCISVQSGGVQRIGPGPTTIPRFGYVIEYRGSARRQASRFRIDLKVSLEPQFEPDHAAWSQVREGVGAGPRLVRDGRLAVNPAAEGFRDPKILKAAATRSAIGVMPNGDVLLVVCDSATISALARKMLKFGCRQAMNLDGGASSGLYGEGRVLVEPGRTLSNALMFR